MEDHSPISTEPQNPHAIPVRISTFAPWATSIAGWMCLCAVAALFVLLLKQLQVDSGMTIAQMLYSTLLSCLSLTWLGAVVWLSISEFRWSRLLWCIPLIALDWVVFGIKRGVVPGFELALEHLGFSLGFALIAWSTLPLTRVCVSTRTDCEPRWQKTRILVLAGMLVGIACICFTELNARDIGPYQLGYCGLLLSSFIASWYWISKPKRPWIVLVLIFLQYVVLQFALLAFLGMPDAVDIRVFSANFHVVVQEGMAILVAISIVGICASLHGDYVIRVQSSSTIAAPSRWIAAALVISLVAVVAVSPWFHVEVRQVGLGRWDTQVELFQGSSGGFELKSFKVSVDVACSFEGNYFQRKAFRKRIEQQKQELLQRFTRELRHAFRTQLTSSTLSPLTIRKTLGAILSEPRIKQFGLTSYHVDELEQN